MYPLGAVATQVIIDSEKTNKDTHHFIEYCTSNPNAVKLYRAYEMILMIHSDAAYLVEPELQSHPAGFFYLGNKDRQQMNGPILILAKIIKNEVASVSEAEIAALFMNARLALPLREALEEVSHKQPATEWIT